MSTQLSSVNHLHRLPQAIFIEILKQLPMEGLSLSRRTCQSWNTRITNTPALWQLARPLNITSNNLGDAIRLVSEDAYVVVHAGNGRFFHKCMQDIGTDKQAKTFLQTHRVIYINVSSMPGLLDDGEWNYYITSATKTIECVCKLKDAVSQPNNAPHKAMFGLGY